MPHTLKSFCKSARKELKNSISNRSPISSEMNLPMRGSMRKRALSMIQPQRLKMRMSCYRKS